MGFAHQPCHAMLAESLSGFTQAEEDTRRTIDAWLAVNDARISRSNRASSCARFDTGCKSQ
jgi:hypothetical protein